MQQFTRFGRDSGQKIGQLGLEAGIIFGVQGHIDDEVLPIDQQVAHSFQFGQHTRPIFLHLFGKLAQQEEIANAAHLLADPGRFVEMGTETAVDHRMPRWNQPGLVARLSFQHNLPEPALIVQFHRQQNIAHNIQHILRLLRGGFGAQKQPGHAAITVGQGRGDVCRVNAARFTADAL